MGISEVLFIAEAVISMMNESISNTVGHFWSINDIEIEFWEELISADLMMIELTGSDEVF